MTRSPPAAPTAAEDVVLGPLTDSLGFLLRMAQVQVFDYFFADLGRFGLRPGEFSVLWVIRCNPAIRQGLLAQRLRIKRAHMTKLIRTFEDRGLVTRGVPDDDRRAVELRLTPEGEAFVTEHFDAFFTHDAHQPSRLDPREQAQLVGLLQRHLGLVPTTCALETQDPR